MADIAHVFSSDLSLSPSGDILTTATTAQETQERVIRRLMTAPFATPFHPDYGAGLPGFVGSPALPQRIQAVIARHMRQEQGVGSNPAPSSTVTGGPDGTFTARVRYADLEGTPQQVTVAP